LLLPRVAFQSNRRIIQVLPLPDYTCVIRLL
jgi:hypothetical protein